MQRSRRRFEEPGLRRAGRCSVPSAQLQQSQKPGILRPQTQQLPGHLGWNHTFGIAPTHSGHRMARRTFRPVVRDRRTLGMPRQLPERSERPSKRRSIELGLGLDVEVSVVGADRHEEVVQEALKPGQAERVGPWITEPDWRVPGELIGAVSHREADAS